MERNLCRRFSTTIVKTLSVACVILSLGVTCFARDTAVITLGNVSGAPGSSVVVPISLATTGGAPGPTTFGFDLLYDNTKFDTQSVVAGPVLPFDPTDPDKSTFFIKSYPAVGKIRIGGFGTPVIPNGVIVNVTFKIKSTAPSGEFILTIGAGTAEVLDENADLIPSSVVPGKITVTGISVPLAITTTSLTAGTVGTAYNQLLGAKDGTKPYTWSKVSGTLPTGLSISTGGVISGTPTATGTFTFTVRVTDSKSAKVDKPLSIVINPALPAGLAIKTLSLPDGTVGIAYAKTALATGGVTPYTWSKVSGTLPTGLSLSTGGAITGTPTVAGTFTFTVRVTDSKSVKVDKPLSIVINPALPVTLPTFSGLKFLDKLGNPINTITDNIFVDTPIKAKGDYTAGSDESALAMSQWVINDPTLVDAVFVDTTVSGDSSWLPANMLEPGKAYILKGRAKNNNGAWSAWTTLNFNTISKTVAADADGDGVPDDQAPTDTFIQQPDTKTIKFWDNLIQAESTNSDTVTYFAGIARLLEALPSGSSAPYGVFTTRIEVLKGASVTVKYTFPEALPSGTGWYKYDESAPAGSKWVEYSVPLLLGKTVTVDLQDGGKGDADGVANGIILDPAGPVVSGGTGGGCTFNDSGDSGSLPVGPLAAGISALLVWLKRRKQR